MFSKILTVRDLATVMGEKMAIEAIFLYELLAMLHTTLELNLCITLTRGTFKRLPRRLR